MQRTILICLAVALFACAAPRKAQRKCERAARHIGRAVWLCPDVLKHDSVKVLFTVPGSEAEGRQDFTSVDPDDSLRAVIAQLHDALQSERELFLVGAATRVDTVKVNSVIELVRDRICVIEGIAVDDPSLSLKIWVENGAIRYEVDCKPQVIERTVAGNPAVDLGAAVEVARAPTGSSWWKWIIAAIFIIIAGFLLHRRNQTDSGLHDRNPGHQ